MDENGQAGQEGGGQVTVKEFLLVVENWKAAGPVEKEILDIAARLQDVENKDAPFIIQSEDGSVCGEVTFHWN